ncbi:MAG: hypothetical protein MUF48_04490 [Pirellulaceae bacterium]|jgi:hypothetical protein|nr:hypothetical protein [Pirellulaceae bacterium]
MNTDGTANPRKQLADVSRGLSTMLATLAILLGVRCAVAFEPAQEVPLADKTLVAWVLPANLEQQGSGAVALMDGEQFDAIVLGEILRGRWMPGSDFFRRTQRDQSGWPAETATADQLVQIAIVYAGHQVTLYRNGQLYARYDAGGQQPFARRGDVLIGARYRAGMGTETGFFAGDIEEVRIYDCALDADQISRLAPGHVGDVKPLGMWTFDDGSLEDRMGHYPRGYLQNGATIVDGRLRLDGRGQYMVVTHEAPWQAEKVQAGFFTPQRVGQMWDTWVYYHEGRFYQYYLAGPGGRWDGHELAVSEDGVHWTEHGVMIKPRAGVTWMGTGHIWETPDGGTSRTWVMNYSEWFGPKQDIMFATSTDLLTWTKVDEKHRFVQDTRWYQELGRWDCIDTIRRQDGSLYGYFTADPDRAKIPYDCCGFGMAESPDGISWTALSPPPGDISGEFGGIQPLNGRYYILISEGRVAVGDRPEGPFLGQRKNHNLFGTGCDIYFPRFFHNAPGGPLVNHFYTGGPVFAAPLKALAVDDEGILRLKWWKNNDLLKARRLETSLVAADAGYHPSIRLFDQPLPSHKVHVIEGVSGVADAGQTELDATGHVRRGIYLDQGDGHGQFLAFGRASSSFGDMRADGSGAEVQQTSRREIDFGPSLTFRLVIKYNMAELYINDYLMNLKRVKWNGRLGLISTDPAALRQVEVWQSH